MRIPVDWLREFLPAVPTDEPGLHAFADALTMAGLEVEEFLPGPTLYTKITPNRGDWASIYGTAREAAAALRLPLVPLASVAESDSGDAAQLASVSVEDAALCPYYSATVIRGVKIGPSPQWMQDRLTNAKMRPLNNVVDITNYVMLELGQPLHAFDLNTLPGGQIVVRLAQPGETLRTLDDVERILTPEMLCICDATRPIAVAGVMGGGPTEVTDSTTDILLESAHFDALSIRRTSKRLGLQTEASYRFERFVDPNLVPIAAARAAQLLVELAGGTLVPGTVEVRSPVAPRRILARMDRIRKLLGADVDRDEAIAALERLGCSVERSAGALDILVPSWRPDLTMEDDIAEEVGRIALGYANLPETLPPIRSGAGRDSALGLFTTRATDALVGLGMQETRSHALTAPSPIATEEEVAHRVLIRSALSAELSSLRTSLLPNLLQTASRAFTNGQRDLALFEIGQVYRRNGAVYAEPQRITGILTGATLAGLWAIKADSALPMDFWYVRSVVEELIRALGITSAVTAEAGTHPGLHSGRTAFLVVDGVRIGFVGELSESTVAAMDLPRRVYVFDLDGDAIRTLTENAERRFQALPRFPAVTRDLAPVFSTSVAFGRIETVAVTAAGPLLEDFRLTDVYEGANLGSDRRSLTLRLTFRSPDATLKDIEVETALQNVRSALTQELGAELRS